MVCEGSIVFLQVRLLHPSEYKYEYDNIRASLLYIYLCLLKVGPFKNLIRIVGNIEGGKILTHIWTYIPVT